MFRFKLRTLLLAITALGIWMGWLVSAARRQAEAVADVRKLGGWVLYDFEFDPTVRGTSRNPTAQSRVPRWLLDRASLDLFHSVVHVNMVYNEVGGRLDNELTTDSIKQTLARLPRLRQILLKETQATDECLAAIGHLSRLERLYCWDAQNATDAGVAQLRHLRSLRYVHLSQSKITDESLRVFGQMPQLEGLCLQQNAFTDAGLAHLTKLRRLKELWIDLGETEITDAGIAHLQGLKSLQTLAISDTHATTEGVAQLKRNLPALKTIYYSAATRPQPSSGTRPIVNRSPADADP